MFFMKKPCIKDTSKFFKKTPLFFLENTFFLCLSTIAISSKKNSFFN